MTRWYRAYEGTVTDPKLAEAAMVAGCSRSVAVAAWHLTLENAAAVNDSGRIDIPALRIAAALCEPLALIESLVAAFGAIGIVSGSRVAAWNRRQYLGDNSLERVRKHRAKKTAETLPCNGEEPLRNADETDHRHRHNTEGSEANASGAEPPKPLSASDITKAIFDTGVSVLMAGGRDNRTARTLIGRWRKEYHDSEVLTMLSHMPDDVSDALEWGTKALQAGRAKSTGKPHGSGQRNGFSGQGSTRDLGMEVAAEFAERRTSGGIVDIVPRLSAPGRTFG